MRTRPLVLAASIWSIMTVGHLPSLAAQGRASDPPPTASLPQRELLETYCVTCHHSRLDTGGVALDSTDLSRVAENPDLWQRVVRKLRSGTMPPQGMPRPDQSRLEALARVSEW